MSLLTNFLELFKYEPVADAGEKFNFTIGLNNNWDKIEAFAVSSNALHGTTALTTSAQVTRTAINELKSAIDDINTQTQFFGTSSTAAATAEKAVTATGFEFVEGNILVVAFSNANTASSPTLNVNSGTAKSILSQTGGALSAEQALNILSGKTIQFVVDEANNGFRMINPALTRVWVSGEYTPVKGTPTSSTHNLSLPNPRYVQCDVLLKCSTAEAGYSIGDYAHSLGGYNIVGGYVTHSPLIPVTTTNSIQVNTPNYGTSGVAVAHATTGVSTQITAANWRYVFRIFY